MGDPTGQEATATHPLAARLDALETPDAADSLQPTVFTPADIVSAISRDLVGSLDPAVNVAELARMVVPFLGSWSIVSLVDEDGAIRDAGSWHVDPVLRGDVAAYSEGRIDALPDDSMVVRAARTGDALVFADNAYATLHARMRPGRTRDLLDKLRPRFVAVLPMVARGRTVGLLSVFSDTPWTSGRRTVADDLTARAALVIDNSMSYERERAARAAAEAAEQRLSLLAQVSEVLSSSDDPDEAVGGLAQLVVPALADWAFVTVIGEDGSLRDIGVAHRDPTKLAQLQAYAAVHLEAMSDDAAVARALRTAAPVIVPEIREEILTSFMPDEHVAELVRTFSPFGVASFPLNARGRTLGALTLATTAQRGAHTEAEIATGLEISRRAGPVLDAARAALRARTLAESIQRGMLETAPAHPQLRVATRYRPAYLDREIGGDWYDTFGLPGGSTMVSIGDVMGHDVAAIAAMAQVRTLMRAVAWTLRRSPAQILGATDAASLGLGPATFATAVVAELARPHDDGSVDVRWSSAGHLPPAVIRPDGTVELLHAAVDVPLGVEADSVRHDHDITLSPGSVLLLYTDGLVERRNSDLDTGLAELVAALTALRDHDLDALLDALLLEFAGDALRNDDVALLAVRIGGLVGPAARPTATPLRLALPPTVEAPGLARDFLTEHCGHVPAQTLADAQLLVSELVTNAVRYSRPQLSLDLTVTRDTIRVAVNDTGPELVVRHSGAPDTTSPGGRGLLIVQQLASAWGVRHVDGSQAKSVWFDLPYG